MQHVHNNKQRVRIIRISNKRMRKMYFNLERHTGKKGIVIGHDFLRFQNTTYSEAPDLPEFISICIVRLEDGDIIQVPEEMLELV